MEYRLKINEEKISVKMEKSEDALLFEINEKMQKADFSRISDNEIHIQITENGKSRSFPAYSVQTPEGKSIFINGRTFLVEDEDAAPTITRGKGKGKKLPDTITPPTPAVVARILVEKDQEVKKSDPVIVVSAMKMETTLAAPYDGTVTAINVNEGDRVMPGEILVDIEKLMTS